MTTSWLLSLAHPVLPLLRVLTVPAARRYLAGWAAAASSCTS